MNTKTHFLMTKTLLSIKRGERGWIRLHELLIDNDRAAIYRVAEIMGLTIEKHGRYGWVVCRPTV